MMKTPLSKEAVRLNETGKKLRVLPPNKKSSVVAFFLPCMAKYIPMNNEEANDRAKTR